MERSHIGLRVLCLPTEPVAAGLGNEIHLRGDGLVIVYDLGGGTFDCSLIRVTGNLLEVLQTNGDPHLGGQDVNARIREHALRMFEEEHGYIPDPVKSAVFHGDLDTRVEQFKTALTTRETASLIINDGAHVLNRKVKRSEVESWIGDLVQRSLDKVTQTLDEAGVGWDDVTAIFPVGGGSRMPLVQQALERLSGKKVSQNVEPDYAAALGGVVAARMEIERQGRRAESESGTLPPLNYFSREVTSHPLGVSALNGSKEPVQNVLLSKGTPYPSTQIKVFGLVQPNQIEAEITVLEGEAGASEKECLRLGAFHLKDLPPYPDIGTDRIEVEFHLDANGLLTAKARDLKSGIMADMKIEYKAQNGNSDKE